LAAGTSGYERRPKSWRLPGSALNNEVLPLFGAPI
jgi:hypothetical protein